MNDGRDPATQRRRFLRATSWPSGGDVIGEKPDPVKDTRPLINRSASHEPNPKNSKERKTSTGKGFKISVLKTKRRKKSSDPSSNAESYVKFKSTSESNLEASVTISGTAASSYSEAAQQSCETEVGVPEAQRPSSLSSGESIPSPLSPEYESGFISVEGNVQFKFSNCSFCFRRDLMLMISMLNSQFRRSKRISF